MQCSAKRRFIHRKLPVTSQGTRQIWRDEIINSFRGMTIMKIHMIISNCSKTHGNYTEAKERRLPRPTRFSENGDRIRK